MIGWQLDGKTQAVLRLLAQGLYTGKVTLELKISQQRVYSIQQKLRRRFGVVTNENLISRVAAEGFLMS